MRNLILLEQDYKEIEDDISELYDRIIELEIKLGLSSTSIKEITFSSTRQNQNDILLEKYISLKIKYDLKKKQQQKIKNTINFYYDLYKNAHNENEMIFIEKNMKKYSIAKISVLHGGMPFRTIYNKLNDVYNKYSNLLQSEKEEQEMIQLATNTIINELKAIK